MSYTKNMIIGLAGTNGSGKDTVAHMLVERHGFYFASSSDMLAAELIRRGLPLERANKSALSTEWRENYGLGAIVDRAIEDAKKLGHEKVVVGSLRNPGEADRVHELGGVVIWVDADPKIRYARITSNNRGRVEDQKTFEQFLAEEAAEMTHSGDENTLNMSGVKAKADAFIANDGANIDEFKDYAEKMLASYLVA